MLGVSTIRIAAFRGTQQLWLPHKAASRNVHRWQRLNKITRCSSGLGPTARDSPEELSTSGGNHNGGNRLPNNGGGDWNGDGGDWNGDGETECREDVLNLAQAESIAADKGFELPKDYMAAAKSDGLRASTLLSFSEIQGIPFVGMLVWAFPWVRDRMVADSRFLFKVLTEVTIDSACATVAEFHMRGNDFLGEFEFYFSDMVVGCILDVALVTMLAPVSIIGARPKSSKMKGIQRWLSRLPSAMFESATPNLREYTAGDRMACFLVKGFEYALVGLGCGFLGQGMANTLMILRRRLNGGATMHDVAIPPLLRTALVWAAFMGGSSNVRYQIVVGLERLVDLSVAKSVPEIAYGTTIVIRFINNVIGGAHFVDMARWAGVQ